MGYLRFPIIGLLALAACTPTTQAAFDAAAGQGVESLKRAENAKARLALQAPCAITIGAKNRVLSEDEKGHVEALCGGSSERPVTVEDLQRLLAIPR